jgi:hypothetical protein
MTERKKPTPTRTSRLLSAEAFAAISAVEGLRLSPAGRKRLEEAKAANLTPDERRTAILRAYTNSARHK